MKYKSVHIYFNEENHRKFKTFCANSGQSMNNFIHNAIKEKMEKDIKKNRVIKEG